MLAPCGRRTYLSWTNGYEWSEIAVTSRRPSSAHSFSFWMSCSTCSNSKPRVSTAPAAIAQNMIASSGSGLCPSLISTGRGYLHWFRGERRAERRDPGLPEGDLQARDGVGAGVDLRARRAPAGLGGIRERDGEEARRPRARRARALPRC